MSKSNAKEIMEVEMTEPNYESKWWGYIYDQMMEHLPDLMM